MIVYHDSPSKLRLVYESSEERRVLRDCLNFFFIQNPQICFSESDIKRILNTDFEELDKLWILLASIDNLSIDNEQLHILFKAIRYIKNDESIKPLIPTLTGIEYEAFVNQLGNLENNIIRDSNFSLE